MSGKLHFWVGLITAFAPRADCSGPRRSIVECGGKDPQNWLMSLGDYQGRRIFFGRCMKIKKVANAGKLNAQVGLSDHGGPEIRNTPLGWWTESCMEPCQYDRAFALDARTAADPGQYKSRCRQDFVHAAGRRKSWLVRSIGRQLFMGTLDSTDRALDSKPGKRNLGTFRPVD